MEQAVTVSVVIPAHNALATIGPALRSVEEQTYAPKETIVVDDGSEDGTGQWVGRHFPWVRVLRTMGAGPAGARNAGIEAAGGEWVALLDADDVWHPEKLALQVEALLGDRLASKVVAVAGDWVRSVERGWPPMARPVPVEVVDYRDLLILNRFQTSTVLMRRAAWEEVGGFDPEVDGAEDWDLWLRLSRIGRILKLAAPVVMYRDLPTGYSKDVWRVYRTMWRMLEKHRDSAPLSREELGAVLAWHHLRFWVAFLLAGDRAHAQMVGRRLRADGLLPRVGSATTRYLVPFLWSRFKRRWRKTS